jgi:hypothetical protein
MEIYTNDNDLFEIFEKNVREIIDEFISTIDPKTNIINKRKYYIYKFFVDDIDLLYVYGSFNKYDEKNYNFILKNNFTDCGNSNDITCKEENIECYFELEGLLYLDKIILKEINYSNYKDYNIFYKDSFTYENKEFIKDSKYVTEDLKKFLHLETLKNIATDLDKERSDVYNEYSENISITHSGFIICIEKKFMGDIYRDLLYATNKSVTNTIMSLYKKSTKDDTISTDEKIFINNLHNFNFKTDKIKFINYFVDEEDIYDKYSYYKKKYNN